MPSACCPEVFAEFTSSVVSRLETSSGAREDEACLQHNVQPCAAVQPRVSPGASGSARDGAVLADHLG